MRSARINCSLVTEFALVQENILLQNERITQLYVIQSAQDPLIWFGVVFVDCGIYKGSVIRFNMIIDESYPNCPCPRVLFSPIPYHPLIDASTGELDTKNAFPDWNSNHQKLYELLLFVKRVIRQADEYILQVRDLIRQSSLMLIDNQPCHGGLSTPNEDNLDCKQQQKQRSQQSIEADSQPNNVNSSANRQTELNQQNGLRQQLSTQSLSRTPQNSFSNIINLFANFQHTLEFLDTFDKRPKEFQRRVEEFKLKCCQQLLDKPALSGDDENALIFTPWDVDIHEPIRNCVLAGRFTPMRLFASYHKGTDSVSFIPGHEP